MGGLDPIISRATSARQRSASNGSASRTEASSGGITMLATLRRRYATRAAGARARGLHERGETLALARRRQRGSFPANGCVPSALGLAISSGNGMLSEGFGNTETPVILAARVAMARSRGCLCAKLVLDEAAFNRGREPALGFDLAEQRPRG